MNIYSNYHRSTKYYILLGCQCLSSLKERPDQIYLCWRLWLKSNCRTMNSIIFTLLGKSGFRTTDKALNRCCAIHVEMKDWKKLNTQCWLCFFFFILERPPKNPYGLWTCTKYHSQSKSPKYMDYTCSGHSKQALLSFRTSLLLMLHVIHLDCPLLLCWMFWRGNSSGGEATFRFHKLKHKR